MKKRTTTTTVVVLLLALVIAVTDSYSYPQEHHYLNQWVVAIKGGADNAERIAAELGYENMGEIGNFADTYLMVKRDHPPRSRRHASHLTRRLADDVRVMWAEQQFARQRVKRGTDMPLPEEEEDSFNDPLWSHQWYLTDTRDTEFKHLPKLDLNVKEVWAKGFTGKGVSVTVLDDGLEWNHTDLLANYDPFASLDVNDNDSDPFPKYDKFDSNRHGTRCAGEIAMVANNGKCGVGVAYKSKIGGIRMLDGPVSDLVEGRGLSHNLSHVDIFSASWGPNDDGRTVEGPGRMAKEAFRMGVTQGRGGKGVIYVWAAGNGGSKGDNCNCDGYTGSVYTLSVGSASQHGKFPWYGEKCASTLACTYSSGAYTDQKICSTDLHNACTVDHTGTSAAAPLAAGIVALVLEANPSLTWRDVQHLVVWTSEFAPLRHNDGWQTNAAGLRFNCRFGYGLMNAASMVETAAANWTNVPPKAECRIKATTRFPVGLAAGSESEVTFESDNCAGSEDEVNWLEHVEVQVYVAYKRRGALEAYLQSPGGTKTSLLLPRTKDFSTKGFPDWTFMSVHTWGEKPGGTWKLTFLDKTNEANAGTISSATLVLHGTKSQPRHLKTPRVYNENYDRAVDDDNNNNNNVIPEKDPFEKLKKRNPGKRLDWNDLVGMSLRRTEKYYDDYDEDEGDLW